MDAGNSRLKWCLSDGMTLYQHSTIDNRLLKQQLLSEWKAIPRPQRVLLANSAGPQRSREISYWVDQHWGTSAEQAVASTIFGKLKNGYLQPQQLGVDRWLGMVAAWNRLERAFCLIDIGTAITIDFVDNSGAHQGGVILPGFGLTMKELLSEASHLAASNISTDDTLLGRSTSEGLREPISGAIDDITTLRTKIMSRYGPFTTIATGGGINSLLPLQPDVEHFPNLVLEGLLTVSHV